MHWISVNDLYFKDVYTMRRRWDETPGEGGRAAADPGFTETLIYCDNQTLKVYINGIEVYLFRLEKNGRKMVSFSEFCAHSDKVSRKS